ncbi:5-formyltetrahydrofolate cyclo-ligase isoform X2 [Electrophorus electricus]|uniref:5-formyltetrahydrofolate cyclo-ligase isoform X2 n=1 Tax=Electrophorus electricus TaxID=8005 RepID=UPI0015D0945F|nr:5-formyltetrahydrofolate cyclo-ligase isoform X2 [Electrophorus electricus]
MATLRAAKQALRKEVKKRLASLSEEEKLRQSQIVSQKLFQHPRYKSSRRVAVFLSMADEVCTDAVVRAVLGSGKACFIPRYLAGGNHMDMLRLKSLEDLASLPITSWNIRQPADSDTEREEALSTGLCSKPTAPVSRAQQQTLRRSPMEVKKDDNGAMSRNATHPR